MINRIDNFSFIFEKWEVNYDFRRVDTESRLDEIIFPHMLLASLRPGFRATVRLKTCKLYESARVEFQFCQTFDQRETTWNTWQQ